MSNSAVPIIASLTGNEPIPLLLPTGNQVFTTPAMIAAHAASNVGQPGGPAGPLDPNGKIPSSQLPISTFSYKGNWNATTNAPTLADGAGTAGDAYLVDVGGTRNLGSGNKTYNIGDVVVYDGAVWDQIPHGGQFFLEIGGNSAAAPMAVGTTTAQPVNIITNNVTRLSFDTSGNVIASAAGTFGWTGRAKISSPADGQILLTNAAGGGFDTLFFGSATGSTAPMLKKVDDHLFLEVADGSRLTALNAQAFLQGFLMPKSGGLSGPEYTSFDYTQAGMTFVSNTRWSVVLGNSEALRLDTTVSNDLQLLMPGEMRLMWGSQQGVIDTAGPGIMSFQGGLLVLAPFFDAQKYNVSSGGGYTWGDTGSQILSPSNGIIRLANAAGTDFLRLQFGGTTALFPSLKRSLTVLQARLADDSNFAPLQGILRAQANAVAETPAATHTLLLQDAAGTQYKVLAVAA